MFSRSCRIRGGMTAESLPDLETPKIQYASEVRVEELPF